VQQAHAESTDTGSIGGTVTDQDTGQPIQGICVFAYDEATAAYGQTQTGTDGTYRITGLPTGRYWVLFYNCTGTGYVQEYYDNKTRRQNADLVQVTAGAETSGIDAALALGGSISGTVTDEDTGQPIEGICVEVSGDTTGAYGFAVTDAKGTYQITGLPTDDYRVIFSDCTGTGTGYVREEMTLVPVRAPNETQVDEQMVLGGSISGTVIDQDTGQSIEGICGQVLDPSEQEVAFLEPDRTGRYLARGIPEGVYKLFFFDCNGNPPEYLPEWFEDRWSFESATDVVVWKSQETAHIDVRMSARTGSPRTLTVTVDGQGSVSTEPGGIDCPPTCAASFAPGSSVTLAASPAVGWIFDGWSGNVCSGTGPCTIVMNGDLAVRATFRPSYLFQGFLEPVDNEVVNVVKAGSTIPVKWHLTDADGHPVSDPETFVALSSSPHPCGSSTATEWITEQATGESGLQYLGDGYWQFNWKTKKTYTSSCRTMVVTLSDGSTHTAEFMFR